MGKLDRAMTQTEASVRNDLAAVYRICHKLGLNEGVCNHLSAAVPGYSDRFLVIPYGLLWSEVTPENLVVIDSTGMVINNNSAEVEIPAFQIHRAIHEANPQKNRAVLHTHMPYATALCCVQNDSLPNGERLQMCCQNALRFWNAISYDEIFKGLVLDPEEGNRLAETFREKSVGLQRHHGVVVCGSTVAEAFDDLYFLEQAARIQVLAMQTNLPLVLVDEEVCKLTKEVFDKDKPKYARTHLDAWKRQLLREDPTLRWLEPSVPMAHADVLPLSRL